MSWLLEEVEAAERGEAEAVLDACPALALRAGASYSAARLPAAELLLVEDGLCLLTRARAGSGRRMILRIVGGGAVLRPPGHDERLDVLALTRITVVTADARRALVGIPSAAGALLDGLAAGLGDAYESLGHFASVRHVERVRDKLVQLARMHGRVVPGGIRLDLPLTHELLGEMVGSARETVTWAMGQLAREGFLRREGRSYRLTVAPESLAS